MPSRTGFWRDRSKMCFHWLKTKRMRIMSQVSRSWMIVSGLLWRGQSTHNCPLWPQWSICQLSRPITSLVSLSSLTSVLTFTEAQNFLTSSTSTLTVNLSPWSSQTSRLKSYRLYSHLKKMLPNKQKTMKMMPLLSLKSAKLRIKQSTYACCL